MQCYQLIFADQKHSCRLRITVYSCTLSSILLLCLVTRVSILSGKLFPVNYFSVTKLVGGRSFGWFPAFQGCHGYFPAAKAPVPRSSSGDEFYWMLNTIRVVTDKALLCSKILPVSFQGRQMLQTNPEELIANTFSIVQYPGHMIQHLAITYSHLDILITTITLLKKTLYREKFIHCPSYWDDRTSGKLFLVGHICASLDWFVRWLMAAWTHLW